MNNTDLTIILKNQIAIMDVLVYMKETNSGCMQRLNNRIADTRLRLKEVEQTQEK